MMRSEGLGIKSSVVCDMVECFDCWVSFVDCLACCVLYEVGRQAFQEDDMLCAKLRRISGNATDKDRFLLKMVDMKDRARAVKGMEVDFSFLISPSISLSILRIFFLGRLR